MTKTLKQRISTHLATGLSALALAGCGRTCGELQESAAYETITGDRGTVTLYPCNQSPQTYEGAKIIYSSSDTRTLLFKTRGGKKLFWQGDALVEVE